MSRPHTRDLVVLVADTNMEQAVRGLLARTAALGIRPTLTFDVFVYPRRDPGVFADAPAFLRSLQREYHYALVMLDLEGCGQPGKSASQIETDLQHRLDKVGWKGRSAVVVLDPELEIWVFSRSRQVINIIAGGDAAFFHQTLKQHPSLPNGKPSEPKIVMEELLARRNLPRSSALYRRLAEKVSLTGCQDEAFNKFRHTLRNWFPQA